MLDIVDNITSCVEKISQNIEGVKKGLKLFTDKNGNINVSLNDTNKDHKDFDSKATIQDAEVRQSTADQIVNDIIITLGAKGSKICNSNNEIHIPVAKPKKVLDTTGAGDAYRAGLITGIYHSISLEDSCKLGSIVGSFAVESYEPQNQNYDYDDIKNRYEENFGKFPLA